MCISQILLNTKGHIYLSHLFRKREKLKVYYLSLGMDKGRNGVQGVQVIGKNMKVWKPSVNTRLMKLQASKGSNASGLTGTETVTVC